MLSDKQEMQALLYQLRGAVVSATPEEQRVTESARQQVVELFSSTRGEAVVGVLIAFLEFSLAHEK
jgi:hypothetical protein